MEDYIRFLAVAEHRSISRAAEALHISQPALSRTISLLEARYRTPLFHRTPQGVELSDLGKVLFIYASRAVRAIDSAREDIENSLSRTNLHLTVCCGDSWGYGILPRIVGRFCRENADVSVRLDVVEHEVRMRGLETRYYELAFGVISPEFLASGKYEFEPLVEAPYDIYCDSEHPLRRKGQIAPEDLLEYPWINHRFEYDYDPSLAQRTHRHFALRTNALLHAIGALRGSTFLLSTAKTLKGHFARFGIVPLMEDPESPRFVSGAVRPRDVDLRPMARKFLTMVQRTCRNCVPVEP